MSDGDITSRSESMSLAGINAYCPNCDHRYQAWEEVCKVCGFDETQPCDWCGSDAENIRAVLDGDALCQDCANRWVQGERDQ